MVFDRAKWSRHWATLQESGDGCQFTCSSVSPSIRRRASPPDFSRFSRIACRSGGRLVRFESAARILVATLPALFVLSREIEKESRSLGVPDADSPRFSAEKWWKSGPLGPRKSIVYNPGFSPGG